MGKHFGELARLRGIVQFKISPHEQRAFAGAISQGLPNIFRRIWSEVFYIGIRKFLLHYSFKISINKNLFCCSKITYAPFSS